MNCWKQPVPNDILYNESIDTLSRLLFFEIIVSCQNKDRLVHFTHNEKKYSVELKRGQCIFKVDKFAKGLKMGRKKVRKSLETISKWYSEMDIKGMPYGCILTLKNYDELVKMDSEMDIKGTIEGQSRDNKGTSNKSVKSEESVKDICGEKSPPVPKKIKPMQKHIQIINMFALMKKIEFETKEKYGLFLDRNFRQAGKIAKAYDLKEIAMSMIWCSKTFSEIEWGLEAVSKNIHKTQEMSVSKSSEEVIQKLINKSLEYAK